MITYKDSGVNIDAGNESVNRIKKHVRSTFGKNVINDIGSFGSLFNLADYIQGQSMPLLVQSTDSIGTKTKIACLMNKYDTIGRDIVAHCANDILVQGAKPLTFLDYIAVEKVYPAMIEDIVKGMSFECKEASIALVGGEIAELPGVYKSGECDVVGTISGIVQKDKLITGHKICAGDLVFGFSSSGLHTNGYSLARKVLFEHAGNTVYSKINELGNNSLGDILLTPHRNYTIPICSLIEAGVKIKGLAHITGGGFIENIPRILPAKCSVKINKQTWPILSVFSLIQKLGNITDDEMFRTFNMGIGMVVILSQEEKHKFLQIMNIINKHKFFATYQIGTVITGSQSVLFAE